MSGFAEAFQPLNFAMLVLGCVLGLWIGAMPGLGSVNGVAILLPITFLVPPTAAIIFLAAIYYGAMYGGAISSITLGIPGASLCSWPRSPRSSAARSRSCCSRCSPRRSPTSP
jgi:putative tricarboxylic transport membrane protein